MYEYMNITCIRKGLLLTALFFLAGFSFCLRVEAADLDNIETLMDKARNNGEIRIIVTMDTPELPDRASMSAQAFDSLLASAVSVAQTAVIDTLPPETIISEPRRFTYTAQFAVTVTADGLTTLYENPNVIGIGEDIPEPPLLDQSVPHIFSSHATSSYSGNGWTVAILDTGVDKAHSFLSGKVVSEACYSTNDPFYTSSSVCPGGVSSSTATDSGLPCDASINGCNHGTHVGGIAAGDGTSFDGVARDAGLIAIQVFSRFSAAYCGSPTPCVMSWRSDQISALNRVYALRSTYNISSINMSLGGGYYTSACDTDPRKSIIDTLKSAGIATVIASGNDGYLNGVGAPGCISTAVTIGATNDTVDQRAGFSNSGPQLDLYAPGVNINSSVPGGGYASWNGTSMATPHVAGAWAVLKQRFPAYTVDQIENAFDGSGVTVTQGSISRQRIDITEALGETPSTGLRLTTVEPCRIVDTRNAGGMITAGSTRAFLVSGSDSDIQDQGGTGNCGISSTSGAVVLNITSNQAGNNGYLTVYPYNSSQPNASIVNYTPGLTIANATTTPICQPSCLYDITVYSAQDSHVIIDVMGYFE